MWRERTIGVLRRRLAASLDQSCTIEREVGAIDAMGAPVHTWQVVASDVACRVIRAGREDLAQRVAGGAEVMRDEVRIILSHEAVVDVDYRIAIGDAVYDVVSIEDAMSAEVFVGVVAVRRRGG
jgi:head-tail adaptor